MGKKRLLLLALLVACCALVATVDGYVDQYEGEGRGGSGGEESPGGNSKFLLQESMHVVKTDAGEMRVIRGDVHGFWTNPMHIGLINMEPNSLFIPQYLDSSIILFIRTGTEFTSFLICMVIETNISFTSKFQFWDPTFSAV